LTADRIFELPQPLDCSAWRQLHGIIKPVSHLVSSSSTASCHSNLE